MAAPNPLASVRSLLFTPATHADRFAKAESSGADAVILDLEDAVAPPDKDRARAAALAHVAGAPRSAVLRCLRINSPRTPHGLRDLLALVDDASGVDAIVVPKVDAAADVDVVAEVVASGGRPVPALIALVETTRALAAAREIAAHRAVAALALGGADLVAELDAVLAWEPLLLARSQVVHAAAGAGVAAFDVPFLDVAADDARLTDEVTAVRRLGFTGKLAIHPKHVAAINTGFTPSPDEVRRAERIVAAADATPGGVCVVDGRMVDAPVVHGARRTLQRARR